VLNPMVTLDAEPALLDADGSALVIHARADDYVTDPAGNAGDRLACGVVTP
jgi:superoxide dismutase, Cu-Zn family